MNLYTIRHIANSISGNGLSFDRAMELINDCLDNKDDYWRDNLKESKPREDKWVRNARGTKLGQFLERVDNSILAPYDHFFPPYIYGGVAGKSNRDAAWALIGKKKKRTLLKIDMRRFYEHITQKEVERLFANKFNCSRDVAKTIAFLTCVPEGEKSPNNNNTGILGRGFSTSSRIATWCNLDLFIEIFNLMKKKLRGYDPRISIYMDDIGITASRVAPEIMVELYKDILKLVQKDKSNLEINAKKTVIVDYLGRKYNVNIGKLEEGRASFEFVGIELQRNKLRAGVKVRGKISRFRPGSNLTRKQRRRLKGMRQYRASVKEYSEKRRFKKNIP